MPVVLTVNPGSSSKKYALYAEGSIKLDFRFEVSSAGCELFTQSAGSLQTSEQMKTKDYNFAVDKVATQIALFVDSHRLPAVDTVVLKIAVPGTFFQKHTEITETYVAELKKRTAILPQLVPAIVREISHLKKLFPTARLLAASDTAFHTTQTPRARELSLPKAEVDEFDLHRFGEAGLSVASVVRRADKLLGQAPKRLLVCHVGSQVSVTSVKNGKAVDCVSGTSGRDIDCATLLTLMRVKNLRPNEAELYLKNSAGFRGMAGESDFRQLLARKAKNDEVATATLAHFSYNLQKALVASTVALGGLDAVVLTGTAVFRSPELRKLILNDLSHFGMQINQERNDFLIGKDGVLSARNSPVKVVVIKNDEMGEMSRIATELSLTNK